jgi:hypothetical protein
MSKKDIVNEMREFKVDETLNILKCLYGMREMKELLALMQEMIDDYESRRDVCSVGWKFDFWVE